MNHSTYFGGKDLKTVDTTMHEQNSRLLVENKALQDTVNRLLEENQKLKQFGVKETKIIYDLASLPYSFGNTVEERLAAVLVRYQETGILVWESNQVGVKDGPSIIVT